MLNSQAAKLRGGVRCLGGVVNVSDPAETRLVIELLSDRAPWIATTAGEKSLFLLLDRHDEWRILADTLQGASLLMERCVATEVYVRDGAGVRRSTGRARAI
jgi:hypothetical protein